MANAARNAILRAKLAGILTDINVKTIAANVYVDETTTLDKHLLTLAKQADLETLQNAVNALGGLAGKDKISEADLDEALTALIGSKAAQTDLDALSKTVQELTQAGNLMGETVEGHRLTLETLVGTDTGKSVRTIANEELAAQLIGENAQESLDTLEEIAAWIQGHPGDAAAMNAAITALQNQLKGIDAGEGTVKKYVDDAITALKIGDYAKAADLTELAGRVTTAEGEINTLKETVNGLGSMAQKNNVAEADLADELREKVNAASEGNHSHNNKAVLDGITAEMVTGWNGKANVYYSETEPANMAEGDLWVAFV